MLDFQPKRILAIHTDVAVLKPNPTSIAKALDMVLEAAINVD
jgi:hypothetical protein